MEPIDKLFSEHASRIRWGARKQWNRLTPCIRRVVDLADLEQEARIACWRAIVEYDAACSVPIGVCISRRISCRLIDYLRHEHSARYAAQLHNGIRSTTDDARRVENSLDARKVLRVMGRDREIVRRWARADATLEEIGRPLGITSGRVCQIRKRALKRARLVLRIAA